MRILNVLLFCIAMFNFVSSGYININLLGTGLFLPYSIGVIGYIKKNMPSHEYRLIGTSGGAWCSLLYALEDDLSNHDQIWNYTIGDNKFKLKLYDNMNEFHKILETNLKNRYKKISPKEVQKLPLSIIATRFDNMKYSIHKEKLSEFYSIVDLIDFCSCSSYIPYISGVLMCKQYNNKYYMDGDIMKHQEFKDYNNKKSTIYIHRKMWGRKFNFKNYIYSDINVSRELYKMGWDDTEKNKDILLKLFEK